MASQSNRDITADTLVSIRKELPVAKLGDNVIAVMNARHDHYYGMEGVAARIWELIEEPCSIAKLCRCLADEYEVDDHRCFDETVRFLCEAEREGLLEMNRR